ncbi:MAG: Gfo/Idh/MocA family oxidoreductase [Thermoplasmatales archaeon]
MRILLLGGNGFGKVHAQSYKNLGIDFSVFSRNREVLEEYKENYDVTSTFDDINQAMKSDFDAVDIVLPHNLHLEYSIKAMEMGKHVLVEKPIATTIEDAKKMINLAKKMKVNFMVAEQYFFDSGLRHALSLISNNAIGKIHTIIIRDQRHFTKSGVWRTQESTMGGGALIDGGIHFIEALLDIGGLYDEVHSFSYGGGSTIQGESNTAAILSFRSGAKGILFYSWGYPYAPVLPSYEIVGTEGSIVEDLKTKPKEDFKTMKSPRHAFGLPVLNGKVSEVKINDVFDQEIEEFVNSIEKGTEVPYKPEMALRNLELVMKIYGRVNG